MLHCYCEHTGISYFAFSNYRNSTFRGICGPGLQVARCVFCWLAWFPKRGCRAESPPPHVTLGSLQHMTSGLSPLCPKRNGVWSKITFWLLFVWPLRPYSQDTLLFFCMLPVLFIVWNTYLLWFALITKADVLACSVRIRLWTLTPRAKVACNCFLDYLLLLLNSICFTKYITFPKAVFPSCISRERLIPPNISCSGPAILNNHSLDTKWVTAPEMA